MTTITISRFPVTSAGITIGELLASGAISVKVEQLPPEVEITPPLIITFVPRLAGGWVFTGSGAGWSSQEYYGQADGKAFASLDEALAVALNPTIWQPGAPDIFAPWEGDEDDLV